jgi:TolA-binding protein
MTAPPTATSSSTTPARAISQVTPVLPSSSPNAPKKTPPISTAEQSLYAKAHQAHFVDHDPAAALQGWEAYLAAYPDGRFSLEARYNRGICLVRLGRRSEARQALAPFAEGTYAGYRQHEARELLDALVASDGGNPAPRP